MNLDRYVKKTKLVHCVWEDILLNVLFSKFFFTKHRKVIGNIMSPISTVHRNQKKLYMTVKNMAKTFQLSTQCVNTQFNKKT